ncbi:MAG: hypothetical protein K2X29_14395 [Candidatus Obscuribacterales bacterium]|nr:hypothetical protein [Candidatus Obscuribacterales bacterium]
MNNNWQERLQLAAEAVAINDFETAKMEADLAHGHALHSGNEEAIQKVKAFFNYMQLELTKHPGNSESDNALSNSDGMLRGAIIGCLLGGMATAIGVVTMIGDMVQGRAGSFFGNDHGLWNLVQYGFSLLLIGAGITVACTIGGLIYAHETRTSTERNQREEEEARRKALLHDRFYQGSTLEDTWKVLTKYFSNEAPDLIRTWTIKTPDTDSGDMVVHWGRNIETTQQYVVNSYSKHPRTENVKVDIHIQGHIVIRELVDGMRLLFFWKYAGEPKGAPLDEDRKQWLMQYFENIWMRVYNELDVHMNCPVELGKFETAASETSQSKTQDPIDVDEAIHRKRLDS